MANSFYLKVISANRVFFSGKCESVVVPEFDGEKEILAHHENMVIAINRGDMRFKPEGESECDSACGNSRASGGNRYGESKRSERESRGTDASETEYS